jgi:hypothetical protein
LLALVLPFELSDSGLLRHVFQLATGFLKLHLEPESVALTVARRRIVV